MSVYRTIGPLVSFCVRPLFVSFRKPNIHVWRQFYPYLANGLSHHNHLGDSTSFLMALGVVLNSYLIFRRNFSKQTDLAPEGTRRSVASHLGTILLVYVP